MFDTELAAAETEVDVPAAAEQPTPAARARMGLFFWCCSAWLTILALVTFCVPWMNLDNPINPVWLTDPTAPNGGVNLAPSWAHPLGTDQAARDVLSRLLWGGRLSLVIALAATAIGIVIGGGLGMLSAYKRGKLDNFLNYVMYTGLAFPAIVAVLAIISFWGRTEAHIAIVLGCFSIPFIYRLIRAATLSCATKEYVTAAKAQGASSWRVLLRDILPNVLPSFIAYTVFTIGGIIAAEGALGILGVGISPPTASWGNIISDASNDTSNLPLVLAPTFVIALTLISLNYVSERIRLRFDVSEQRL